MALGPMSSSVLASTYVLGTHEQNDRLTKKMKDPNMEETLQANSYPSFETVTDLWSVSDVPTIDFICNLTRNRGLSFTYLIDRKQLE